MERKRAKGMDAIAILVNSTNEQLRASATTRLTSLREEIHQAVHAADEEYRGREAEFLEAVTAWKRADSVQERTETALVVGRLQKDLVKLDEMRQRARYPHRYIQQKDLFRNVIDPDTRDMRTIPFPVYVERTVTSDPTERSIQLM
jgi:hypothetical protein